MKNELSFAATIGFFDGVHRGHQFLIESLKQEARQHGLGSMVITFGQHPRQVLNSDWHPLLLTTPEEKETLLHATGIDRLVVLPFDVAMSQLSARQFMEQVLRDQLGVRLLFTGYDNHFGHQERGSDCGAQREGFADYQHYGKELGMEVIGGTPLSEGTLRFSSSLVRRLLNEGDVTTARTCLGRPYRLTGRVIHGKQIGRQLGFPTANMQIENHDKLIPLKGVYAVLLSSPCLKEKHYGMMNIGHRPTFDGHHVTLETHIFDFQGDLYDQTITVDFITRLRDEMPFVSPEALKAQMQQDAQLAKQELSSFYPLQTS